MPIIKYQGLKKHYHYEKKKLEFNTFETSVTLRIPKAMV